MTVKSLSKKKKTIKKLGEAIYQLLHYRWLLLAISFFDEGKRKAKVPDNKNSGPKTIPSK